jgi:predicted DNA-binding protein
MLYKKGVHMMANIKVPDELWARFKSAVALDRKTMTEVVLELVEGYLHEVNSRRQDV